jgi:hypothetical protein
VVVGPAHAREVIEEPITPNLIVVNERSGAEALKPTCESEWQISVSQSADWIRNDGEVREMAIGMLWGGVPRVMCRAARNQPMYLRYGGMLVSI